MAAGRILINKLKKVIFYLPSPAVKSILRRIYGIASWDPRADNIAEWL
jgi:hypothetical protein